MVRWRRIDLKRWIEAEFGVVMHERTVGKQLRELGYRRLSVRSRHPKADEAAQEALKKLPQAVAEAVPEAARGKPLEIWFQDEARVGQQGTLTRVWARRGTRPRAGATPDTNGPTSSAPSAPSAPPAPPWSCPSPNTRR